jgi:hypothetical protein
MSLAQALRTQEQFDDLRNIPGQRGYAVLDLDGNIVAVS